jgi:hypothetical protein
MPFLGSREAGYSTILIIKRRPERGEPGGSWEAGTLDSLPFVRLFFESLCSGVRLLQIDVEYDCEPLSAFLHFFVSPLHSDLRTLSD